MPPLVSAISGGVRLLGQEIDHAECPSCSWIRSLRRKAMATYIILGNFTDQGIRNIKDSPKREDAFRKLCEKMGAKVKDAYRTMGRYDLAAIVDAPDDA